MTEGFEAGRPRPPLQPRIELTSSVVAASSRERFSTQAIFRATERFRTGPEGLFAAVRGELVRTHYYIPEHVALPTDPSQIITVAIASNNDKKVDSILSLLASNRFDVKRIPEAQEPHTKRALDDATGKALDAAYIIQTSQEEGRREIRNRPYVTIANDQLYAVPVITEDPLTHQPVITFERLGKPENEDVADPVAHVRQMFERLSATAETNNWPSIPYFTELETIVHNPADPDNNAASLQKSAIFLSKDGVKHLATDKFDEYVERVKEQAAKANGKEGVTAIAGGLELQVLDDMGIVEFVTGTEQDVQLTGFPPQQRPDAKEHAYRLSLGSADERLITDYFGKVAN